MALAFLLLFGIMAFAAVCELNTRLKELEDGYDSRA